VVDRALEETRDNITEKIDEVRAKHLDDPIAGLI
jgi:hypothetical protein